MSRVSTGKVALAVVLLSESVLFGTLLAAYAAMRDQAHWQMGHGLPQIAMPLANTAILLLSVWPAARAAAGARAHRNLRVRGPLALALVLGLVFAGGQVFEFMRAGLRVDDAAFGGVFFALMGFHGLHVLAGVIVLLLNVLREPVSGYSAGDVDAIEVGSLFWYYVVAVWVVLFAALYVI
jgi:heme/copper-type cytochrome/quinol oxidase subunit 3